jgi:hypothetical protein
LYRLLLICNLMQSMKKICLRQSTAAHWMEITSTPYPFHYFPSIFYGIFPAADFSLQISAVISLLPTN